MSKSQLSCQHSLEHRLKSNRANLNPVNYPSRESISSDGTEISEQLRFRTQNRKNIRRFRRKRRASVQTSYNKQKSTSRMKQLNFPAQTGSRNERSPISREKQRKFSKAFTSPTYISQCGNHPLTPVYFPASKQCLQDFWPLRESPDGCSSVSECGKPLFTSGPNSLKFHMNTTPQLHTTDNFYDLISHCCNVKRCNDSFQNEPISRIKQRNFSTYFGSSPKYMFQGGNHSSIPLYSPASKLNAHDFLPFCGVPDGYAKNIPECENLTITPLPNSVVFPPLMFSFYDINTKPPFYAPNEFYEPISHSYDVKRYNDNFQCEKRLYCPSARTPRRATSSNIHKLVIDFIRNSSIPMNICRSPKSSYYQPLNSRMFHCTQKDYSASEESDISQFSTMVLTGENEIFLEDITSSSTEESSSLSESSYNSPEFPYTRPNSWASRTPNSTGWDIEDGTESLNQLMCVSDMECASKRNFPNSRSVSEENGQNETALEIENSSTTSISPEKRQCPSQLQVDMSPLDASIFSLSESMPNENATRSINLSPPYAAILHPLPNKKHSNISKATNLFLEENDQSLNISESNDSSNASSWYRKESLSQDVGELLTTSNLPESPPNSEERCTIENVAKCINQSFASLSLTCVSPTTNATEVSTSSDNANSEQCKYSINKKRKGFKLISCFISCFRKKERKKL